MNVSDAIARIGRQLGPEVLARCQAIFEGEARADETTPVVADAAYGADDRQRLDLYAGDRTSSTPVVLWVHGGGFIRGDKAAPANPFNAHIGRWAARKGLVGAVMNYRLAPTSQWPSGVEDVAAAVAWIEAEGDALGMGKSPIILAGTSAGAVHIAGYVARGPAASVRGAVLLSGLYGFTDLDDRDCLYYGDKAAYPQRMPRVGIVGSDLPLFIACAEHDPVRFQREYVALLAARLERHGALPAGGVIAGHNHFTLAMHIGSRDTRLADQILGFIAGLDGEST